MEIKKFVSYDEIAEKIYTPSFQRELNPEVVSSIKEYIYDRQKQDLDIQIGVMDLCKFNGQLFSVDGRHRLKALEEFYTETKKNITFYAIVYTVSSQEEMEEIFKIRNSGIPVPDFILNPPLGKGPLLKQINSYLRELPIVKISKPGSKANRPSVDLALFMEYLTESELLEICTDLNSFIENFLKINRKIGKKTRDENWIKKMKITDTMLETIQDKFKNSEVAPIYVGLYKSYGEIDDLI